jgi:hypothetical protein
MLKKEYEYYGQQCWYASIEEATQTSPRMARLIGEARQCTQRHLEGCAKVNPRPHLKEMEVNMPLEPKVKATGMEAATKRLELTQEV